MKVLAHINASFDIRIANHHFNEGSNIGQIKERVLQIAETEAKKVFLDTVDSLYVDIVGASIKFDEKDIENETT